MMILFFLLPLFLFATPTETFITEHGKSVIEAEIMYKLSKPEIYKRFSPLFAKAIENEKKPGFFGYHASSLQVSFFQDILREIFETTLEISLPYDFYFLRTPLDPLYGLKEISDYLKEKKGAPITQEVQKEAIQKAFLSPLNELSGLSIQYDELSYIDREVLFQPVLEAHNLISELYQSMSQKLAVKGAKSQLPIPIDELMKKMKEEAKGGYEDLLEKQGLTTLVGKSLQRIVEKKQHAPLTEEQIQLIASLSSKEIPVLRILELAYNLNLKEETPYIRWFLPYNDNFPKNASRLLSMNIPLFGNIFNRGDSTIHVFLTGKTVASNDQGIVNLLAQYFESLGFRAELAKEIFNEINALFTKDEPLYGVLYQFFDTSSQLANLDKLAYVSFPYGAPVNGVTPKELALETRGIDYGGQQVQFRLLMSTSSTLNPFSTFSIKRYDSLSLTKRGEIKALIRKKMASEPMDTDKIQKHKAALLSAWNL